MSKHEQISRLFARSNLVPTKSWPEFKHDVDADWIVKHSGIPWLRLDVKVPVDIILHEIQQAEHLLVDHRAEYNEHRGWKSFCVHGKSLHQTQNCDDDRVFHWIPETEALMPETVRFFKNWSIGQYQRVRIMALEPKGYICMHQDLGPTEKHLSPINIAITQPDNCCFIIKDWGVIPFQAGDAYMPDITQWHAVFNDSQQVRYHIIIHSDTWTDCFKQLIVRSYQTFRSSS